MESKLFKKIYGSLVAGACGDAMGAPVENMHYLDIREQFGRVETFLDFQPRYLGGRPIYETGSLEWHEKRLIPWKEVNPFSSWELKAGVYTDDMRVRLLALKSFIKHGRRYTGSEFVEDIMDYLIITARKGEKDPQYRWARAMYNVDELFTICMKTPLGSSPFVGGIWGAPAGIINACNPIAGAQDGGIMGAIIATAMMPDATVNSVVDAAFKYSNWIPGRKYDVLPSVGENFSQRLEKALETADKSSDIFELTENLYKWILFMFPPWNLNNVLEAVPVAISIVYKAKGDIRESIIGGVNFGRDCDTIANIAGEICGALNGIDTVPQEWIKIISESNPEPNLENFSNQLVETIISNRNDFIKVVENLGSLI